MTKFRNISVIILVIISFAVTAFFIGGCSNNDSGEVEEAGNTWVSMRLGEKEVLRAYLQQYKIDSDGNVTKYDGSADDMGENEAVCCLVEEVLYLEEPDQRYPFNSFILTSDELSTFLKNQWKEYREKDLKAEYSPAEFMSFLKTNRVDIREFFYNYNNSKTSLEEFVEIIESSTEITKSGGRPLFRILALMKKMNITPKEYYALLTDLESGPAHFAQHCATLDYTINRLGKKYIEEKWESPGEFLQAILDEKPETAIAQKGETTEVVFKILETAWNIISHNEPATPDVSINNPQTYVISDQDGDPMAYTGAVVGQSKNLNFNSDLFIGLKTYKYDMDYHLVFTYNAQNPNFSGYWLPAIYFSIDSLTLKKHADLTVDSSITAYNNGGEYDDEDNPPIATAEVDVSFSYEPGYCSGQYFSVDGKGNVANWW